MKDPLAEYRQQTLQGAVDQASPHRLISLLFESLIARIRRAQLACERGEIALRGEQLSRAQDILAALRASLNKEVDAGDLPHNLDALYDYCQRLLLTSLIKSDTEAMAEVIGLIAQIKEAWEQISAQGEAN